MRITSKTRINTEFYKKYPDSIKSEIRANVCSELIKHEVFIEPPLNYRGGFTEIEMVLFALTYRDIEKLKELSEKYPELNEILKDIVVEV